MSSSQSTTPPSESLREALDGLPLDLSGAHTCFAAAASAGLKASLGELLESLEAPLERADVILFEPGQWVLSASGGLHDAPGATIEWSDLLESTLSGEGPLALTSRDGERVMLGEDTSAKRALFEALIRRGAPLPAPPPEMAVWWMLEDESGNTMSPQTLARRLLVSDPAGTMSWGLMLVLGVMMPFVWPFFGGALGIVIAASLFVIPWMMDAVSPWLLGFQLLVGATVCLTLVALPTGRRLWSMLLRTSRETTREARLERALNLLMTLAPWLQGGDSSPTVELSATTAVDQWRLIASLAGGGTLGLLVIDDAVYEASAPPRWLIHASIPGVVERGGEVDGEPLWREVHEGHTLLSMTSARPLGPPDEPSTFATLSALVQGLITLDHHTTQRRVILTPDASPLEHMHLDSAHAPLLGAGALSLPDARTAKVAAWRDFALHLTLVGLMTLGVELLFADAWLTPLWALSCLISGGVFLHIPSSHPRTLHASAEISGAALFLNHERLTIGPHPGIELLEPFYITLSRAPQSAEHLRDASIYLGVELRQRAPSGEVRRLAFCLPALATPVSKSLVSHDLRAPLIHPVDAQQWVWPLLRARAAEHGHRFPWRLEAAPTSSGDS